MKAIWKYTLKPIVTFEMPVGAQVLSVDEQGDDICMWALVDPEAGKIHRKFMVFGTAHNIPEPHEGPRMELTYVGSAQPGDRTLAFHVFEVL